MALAATSSTLYIAQRKRLRGKRLLAQAWFLGKAFLGCACCIGLVWGVTLLYPLVLEAEYFRVRMIDITGLTMLTREEVLYLLGITAETTSWQLDLPRMGTRLTHHPYIKSVVLRREFLQSLRHHRARDLLELHGEVQHHLSLGDGEVLGVALEQHVLQPLEQRRVR